MVLLLEGHSYRYAVEQIMLALFPEERPEYAADPAACSTGFAAKSSIRMGGSYAQAATRITRNGAVSQGYARVRRSKLSDPLTTGRLLQRAVKQSFYRAAISFIESPPEWGSLTGIRPAHIASAMLEDGIAEGVAERTLMRDFYVSTERAGLCMAAARSSLAVKRTLLPQDVALYIGIPFCPTRCAYCSFVSNSVERQFDLIDPFVGALLREIEAVAETASRLGLRVIAVYIGGGTPTALPANSLRVIMEALAASFDLSQTREYTVEAGRPDTITSEKLDAILESGAGRICVNPQSMSAKVLDAIGRDHTPRDTLNAAELVGLSGMALNMDLIAGLPGDNPAGFRASLDEVLGLGPENITVHTLSLKKGSRIMLEATDIPNGRDVSAMLRYAGLSLRERGYLPYYLYRQKYTSGGFENVGWSLPGRECIYNICMMEELCTVLSFGGGGVTKLVSAGARTEAPGESGGTRIERVFNAKYPREYIRKADEIGKKLDKIERFYSECYT